MGWSGAREIPSPRLCLLLPPLPASQRAVLWRSLWEAIGSQPGAGRALTAVLSATKGDWRLPNAPLLGPAEHPHHLRPRGPSPAANKASQTAEWAGKLGAVMGNRCSAGHAGLHLQGVSILGLHHLFLPLQKAVPGCRLARQAWRHPNTPPWLCDNPTARMTSSARLRVHISGYALEIQLEGLEHTQGSACLGADIGGLRGGQPLPAWYPHRCQISKGQLAVAFQSLGPLL